MRFSFSPEHPFKWGCQVTGSVGSGAVAGGGGGRGTGGLPAQYHEDPARHLIQGQAGRREGPNDSTYYGNFPLQASMPSQQSISWLIAQPQPITSEAKIQRSWSLVTLHNHQMKEGH